MTTFDEYLSLELPTEFLGTEDPDIVIGTIDVVSRRATIETEDGNDIVNTAPGRGSNRINLGDGDDIAILDRRDRADGGRGDDTIIGADGARIRGGRGNDVIDISVGEEVEAEGGDGADVFIIGGNPTAVITDFRLEDKVAITGIEEPNPELFQLAPNPEGEGFQFLYDGEVLVNFSELEEDEVEQLGRDNITLIPDLATEFEGTEETDVVIAGFNVAIADVDIETDNGNNVVHTASGEGSNDIELGDDSDVVVAGPRDRVDSDEGNDTLIGASRARLNAGNGDDLLIGASRARLNAGDGEDLLDLSVGRGVQGEGGDGADIFIVGNNDTAIIRDFTIDDRLALKGIEDPDPQLLEQVVNPEGEGFQLLYAGEVVVNFSEIREEDVGQFGPDNFSFI